MSAEQPAFVSDEPIAKDSEAQDDVVWPPEIDARFANRSRLKRLGTTQEHTSDVPFTLYAKNLSDRFAALFRGNPNSHYVYEPDEGKYSSVSVVRRLLLRYATLLNLADGDGSMLDAEGKIVMGEGKPLGIEIFPKQESLDAGKVGNGINLPYFGTERIAFGKRGQELSLPQFLDFVDRDGKWLVALLEHRDLSNGGAAGVGGATAAGTQKENETPRTSKCIRRTYAGILESELQWTSSTTIVTDSPDAITAPETILHPSTTTAKAPPLGHRQLKLPRHPCINSLFAQTCSGTTTSRSPRD